MKLSHIQASHIKEAAAIIDHFGPDLTKHDRFYWVKVDGREYSIKYLLMVAHRVALDDDKARLQFSSDEFYRGHVKSLGFPLVYYKEGLSFFASSELERYRSVAGTRYSTHNEEHKYIGLHLKLLARKVNLWAELSCFGDYRHEPDLHWQLSGNFNKDQWTVIREAGSNPQISFYIGCRGNGDLFVDLHYQRFNLTHVKRVAKADGARLDAYRHASGYSQLVMPFDEIKNHDWDSLIAITRAHIEQHTGLYRELQAMLRNAVNPELALPAVPSLSEEDAPERIRSYANRKRTFEGREVNWESKAATSANLGLSGEKLVINAERKRLEEAGLHEQAMKVAKQGDGAGYDVLSFDEAGHPLHIEVKTTTNGKDEPFYMSAQERAYVDACQATYLLYRVYDFNPATGSGSFYKLSAEEVKSLEFTATGFEVSKRTIFPQ
jgi:hypothetical protein